MKKDILTIFANVTTFFNVVLKRFLPKQIMIKRTLRIKQQYPSNGAEGNSPQKFGNIWQVSQLL